MELSPINKVGDQNGEKFCISRVKCDCVSWSVTFLGGGDAISVLKEFISFFFFFLWYSFLKVISENDHEVKYTLI